MIRNCQAVLVLVARGVRGLRLRVARRVVRTGDARAHPRSANGGAVQLTQPTLRPPASTRPSGTRMTGAPSRQAIT